MLVLVGRIVRAHGIRGEVSVDVRTDSPQLRFVRGVELRTEPTVVGPLTVQDARWHAGRLLVSFRGITDRAAAEALRGVRLLAEVDVAEQTGEPDEYFDYQLVGLRAVTAAGYEVGRVVEVLHLPGQDVLVLDREPAPQVLVPFVAEIVPEVDMAGGRVVLTPPPGLLDAAETDQAGKGPQ